MCQMSMNSITPLSPGTLCRPVGNVAFPGRWCNKIFKCSNIFSKPSSWRTVPPQSHSWNSKYLTEQNHHILQIQYILVAVVLDYVKLLTRGFEILYAWTQVELHWCNSLQLTVSNLYVQVESVSDLTENMEVPLELMNFLIRRFG